MRFELILSFQGLKYKEFLSLLTWRCLLLASILEKRLSLHRHLAEQAQAKTELELQIEQMQALAHIGMVSAMAAHEINNILTPISNYARLCTKHPGDKKLSQKAIEKAIVNTEHASRILESLLAMADGKKQEKRRHCLKSLVEEVFFCIGRDFSKDNIKVVFDIPEGFEVWGEGVCLQQVLMNLFLNAREAMLGSSGCLKISAEENGDFVVMIISDTGSGIKYENQRQIFEPFFTTKDRNCSQQSGRGLGLSFCKKVIENHDGMISLESEPDKGATFKISLPNR
jgi:signal transduction histidine kinase